MTITPSEESLGSMPGQTRSSSGEPPSLLLSCERSPQLVWVGGWGGGFWGWEELWEGTALDG